MKQTLLLIVWVLMATATHAITVTDTLFVRSNHETDFAFGADVSFVPQMESWGTKWLDIDCPEAGQHLLQLIATGASGLPDIVSLRIFPLEGQPLPSQVQLLNTPALRSESHGTLGIYSLSGQLLGHATEAQLGRSLGGRSSALIVLPGSAGSALCIVRRQQKE